jgi:hypothetical protein
VKREQHLLAIELLERLGVDHLRLEPGRDGKYRYVGWTVPWPVGNGAPPKLKRGRVRCT